MLRLLRGRAAAGLSLEDEQRTGVLTQRASFTPLTCGLHLQRPSWAWSSSRVGAGLWCGAPGLGAPRGAAHPHRQAEGPIFWPAAPGGGWKEEEGLPRGWEPPPELCPGQTPSLWTQREEVQMKGEDGTWLPGPTGSSTGGTLSGSRLKVSGDRLVGSSPEVQWFFSPKATETGLIIRTRMLFLLD